MKTFSTKFLNATMSILLIVGSISIAAVAAPKIDPSKELAKVKAELARTKSESDRFKTESNKEKEKLEKELDSVKKESKDLQSKTQAELDKTKKELAAARSELTKSGIEKIKKELGKATAELAKTKAELSKVKSELSKAKTELNEANETIATFESEVQSLTEERDSLLDQLSAISAQEGEEVIEATVDYSELGYEIELSEDEFGNRDEILEFTELYLDGELIELSSPILVQFVGASMEERHIWMNKEIMEAIGFDSELSQVDLLEDMDFGAQFEAFYDDVEMTFEVNSI